MKKPLIIAATLFAIVIGTLIWWFSDTQVLKRQTQQLTESFTIKASDGITTGLSKNQQLRDLLDQKLICTIDLPQYTAQHSHDKLVSTHLYLVETCKSSSVQMRNFQITSLADTEATVSAKFSISVTEKGGTTYSENAPATLTWQKTPTGQWQLTQITVKSP